MKQELETERFVPMNELVVRLGISRVGVYRTAKKCLPGFPKLRRMAGKAGCLESELKRFLAALPIVEVKGATL